MFFFIFSAVVQVPGQILGNWYLCRNEIGQINVITGPGPRKVRNPSHRDVRLTAFGWSVFRAGKLVLTLPQEHFHDDWIPSFIAIQQIGVVDCRSKTRAVSVTWRYGDPFGNLACELQGLAIVRLWKFPILRLEPTSVEPAEVVLVEPVRTAVVDASLLWASHLQREEFSNSVSRVLTS